MPSHLRALRLPLGLMGAVVILTYGAILRTLPRGFDWTDEAFVDVMTASNRVAVGEPLGFQHLLHPLYTLTGESVLTLRFARLVAYVLLGVVLVACARAVAHRIGLRIPTSGWVFVGLLAQFGTFLAWSYPPRNLGYNELASWFTQLGIALIVLSLAWGLSAPAVPSPDAPHSPNSSHSPYRLRDRRVVWSIWAGLGALTMLLVFSKVTSGVAFGALVAVALFVPNPSLPLSKRVMAGGAGATAVLVVLWVGRYPMVVYLKNAYAVLFDQSAQEAFDHSISELIDIYVRSLRLTGRALLPALLIFVLVMATFHRRVRPTGDGGWARLSDRITWALGALLLAALVALPRMTASTPMTRYEMWSYVGVLVVFVGAAGIIGLAVLGADGVTMNGSAVVRSWSVAVAGLAIVAAPFISAVGTNNRLTGEFAFAATLSALVLGIALVRLTERATLVRSSARVLPALIGFVVLLLSAVAVRADIATPYRTAPLLSQGTSTSVPELRGVLLTTAEAAWADWVHAAGERLGARGVPAAAIDSPGALFVFNHSGYANPWLREQAPVSVASLRVACAGHPPADLFVLQPGTQPDRAPSTRGLAQSLAACGVSFPRDFRVVASRVSADPRLALTIWRLKSTG